MNKAYVQIRNGLPLNVDVQNAIDGFEYLGYNIKEFTLEDIMLDKMNRIARNNVVVGSIDAMTMLFGKINKRPEPIDFPQSIIDTGLLNRKIGKMKLSEFIDNFKKENKPMFVKPVETKLFDGALISKKEHLSYLRLDDSGSHDVFVSEPISIISEHRVYVHEKRAIYACNYSGNFRTSIDFGYVDDLIDAYDEQPVSYTIDVAVLDDHSMTVIEFNDFWAIGSYGLYCIDYAQMLTDRYFEIVS